MLRNRRTNLALASRKRAFRIDAEMARDIRHDEQQIAELLGDLLRAAAPPSRFVVGDRRFQLGDFLLGLGEHGRKLGQSKPTSRGALLQLHRARERGSASGTSSQAASAPAPPARARPSPRP